MRHRRRRLVSRRSSDHHHSHSSRHLPAVQTKRHWRQQRKTASTTRDHEHPIPAPTARCRIRRDRRSTRDMAIRHKSACTTHTAAARWRRIACCGRKTGGLTTDTTGTTWTTVSPGPMLSGGGRQADIKAAAAVDIQRTLLITIDSIETNSRPSIRLHSSTQARRRFIMPTPNTTESSRQTAVAATSTVDRMLKLHRRRSRTAASRLPTTSIKCQTLLMWN